ncbi:MAG: cytochrome oxidase subunit III, partial [Flavobacteriaceae bacterium]|nr:cytochrome oxidase subunit III [Flavobacteriaceae bacterium]
MGATIAANTDKKATWGGGGVKPFGASYGKMMMWFFIVSDALTFSGFLAAYGLTRFKFIDSWPIADEVFTHFPFLHGVHAPMYYVALMTFILIFSSVTMVLAVDAGHQMKKKKVAWYMLLTIIGGLIFLGSQAWEWKNFINGSYGAVQTKEGKILQFVKDGHQIALSDFVVSKEKERTSHTRFNGLWFTGNENLPNYSVSEVVDAYKNNSAVQIRIEKIDLATKKKVVLSREEGARYLLDAKQVVEGANLQVNEYGNPIFADFFFFITGFHGFHVFSGVLINIIIFFNVIVGTYERRGHYEMVEKVG